MLRWDIWYHHAPMILLRFIHMSGRNEIPSCSLWPWRPRTEGAWNWSLLPSFSNAWNAGPHTSKRLHSHWRFISLSTRRHVRLWIGENGVWWLALLVVP